jgi:hypothetical protein
MDLFGELADDGHVGYVAGEGIMRVGLVDLLVTPIGCSWIRSYYWRVYR